MELRVLNYFLAVVNEESISKAAKSLNLTQPTLSRQLKDLEDELGVTLFHRGKSKISLTDAGVRLKARAEEIITIANNTKKEFETEAGLFGGLLPFGSVESATSKELTDLIFEFHKKYPNVEYYIYSGIVDEIKEKIDRGIIEFGLLLEPVNVENYNFIRLPQKERWGVVTRTDSELAKKEFITPEDLSALPLMQSNRTVLQNEINRWLSLKDGETTNTIATFNLMFNVMNLVEKELGYLLCLEGVFESKKTEALCFRPLAPELTTGYVIAWKRNRMLSAVAEKFIELARDAFEA
ncbi:LysR family transcriptional regulator [Enterococcus thailandicus]|uniref:LysR family transcriptional regulator n=1 Tax=Enterococcus thailandicus TaxID=417368 RepID=UPI0022EBF16A|nr:LysR family transcriptional regulator [Enterococcus thailandicus]MDA3972765.1 LysR family transcriptional regulator [Enterococcus thailandicus]MDA3975261.1 LysR family transcriptional regulator [Enterococcus thailandicus]MDA3980225.1 LysR family transcriptional regulator [Enterococcus thailandicus]